MNKILGAGAAALLGLSLLAGCGGGDDNAASGGGYCDDLAAAKASVADIGDENMSQASFDKLTASLETIADEAPSDIKDDWNTVASTIDGYSQALKDAGVSLDSIQQDMANLDAGDLQKLTTAVQGLSAEEFTTATTNINEEVKSECDLTLDLGN